MSYCNYKIGKSIINGRIISLHKTYILVSFDGNVGICHVSNVSDYLVKDLNKIFIINSYQNFLIIGDNGFGQYNLSFKSIHPKFLKGHRDVIPTPSGFVNLKKNLELRLKKI